MTTEEVLTQAVSSFPAIALMQWAKNQNLFGKPGDPLRGKLSAIVGALIAFLSAIGVHYHVEGSLTSGFQFAGTIPPADVLLSGFYHYACAWGLQHGLFKWYQANLAQIDLARPAGIVGIAEPLKLPNPAQNKDVIAEAFSRAVKIGETASAPIPEAAGPSPAVKPDPNPLAAFLINQRNRQ